MSRSGGEKGLRLSCAGKLGVPLEGQWYVRELFELIQKCQIPFEIQEGTSNLSRDAAVGLGIILR